MLHLNKFELRHHLNLDIVFKTHSHIDVQSHATDNRLTVIFWPQDQRMPTACNALYGYQADFLLEHGHTGTK